MYAEGVQNNVEEFVGNVNAMQWLALRVKFVEPVRHAGVGSGIMFGEVVGISKGW